MNAICSVCLEVFQGKAEDHAYSSKCGHVFHHKCILDWQVKSPTCPDCRESFTKDDIYKLNFHCEEGPESAIAEMKLKELQLELARKSEELAEVQLQLAQKNSEMQELEETCRTVIENIDTLRIENERLKKDQLEKEFLNLVRNSGDAESSGSSLEQRKAFESALLVEPTTDPVDLSSRH